MIEACCEANVVLHARREWDTLLIAVPILAWSRGSIPAKNISALQLGPVKTQLVAHVLAEGVHLALADFLFSPDQLPESYLESSTLTRRLGASALRGADLEINPAELREVAPFVADTRYVLGAIAAPRGNALFRWQEPDGVLDAIRANWNTQGRAALAPLFPACAFEPLLPRAYHFACREAERESRPYSLMASIEFLRAQYGIEPERLIAYVGGFHDRQLEEYRIGLSLGPNETVIHGLLWPLVASEAEDAESPTEIERLLRTAGVQDINVLSERFPMEYCDDCGAPLYPNSEGEAVHVEPPGDQPPASAHLH